MKKNDLTWRLKELPDAVDVAELVDKKVITPEEARSLLFSDSKQKDTTEENKALKEQVEFLQDTVDKLIDKLNSTSSHWVFTNTYTPSYPTKYWLSTSGTSGLMSVAKGAVSYNASSVQ